MNLSRYSLPIFSLAALITTLTFYAAPAAAQQCTPAPVAGAENELFKDMPPGTTGYEEAAILYREGVTLGCQDNPLLFCPQCAVPRSNLVVMLARVLELDISNPPANPTFSDVPSNHPHYAHVEAAVAAGITNGCTATEFCPGDPVTRAQLATFIRRAAGWDELFPATPTFDDVPPESPHFGSIEQMEEKCVTKGCAASLYCPGDYANRAQTAVFIARAFDLENINPCITTVPTEDAGTGGQDAGADAGSTGGEVEPDGPGANNGNVPISGMDTGLPPQTGGDADTGRPIRADGGCGCTQTAPATLPGAALLIFLMRMVGGARRARASLSLRARRPRRR